MVPYTLVFERTGYDSGTLLCSEAWSGSRGMRHGDPAVQDGMKCSAVLCVCDGFGWRWLRSGSEHSGNAGLKGSLCSATH